MAKADSVGVRHIDDWEAQRSQSRLLADRARLVLPAGVTHDHRYLEPYGLYFEKAKGSRKWDVDGNEYVDYWGGHGSLLLGHCHPSIVAAVARQVSMGSHYGGNHRLEVEWAEIVRTLIPSARSGLVRFFSSGTEATMMAIRLARVSTGKSRIVQVRGHFHGWHDYASVSFAPASNEPPPGVPSSVADTVLVVPPNDESSLTAAVSESDDVAGIIMIPDGPIGYLRKARQLADTYGIPLIFDEVITGFRYAPGGAQELAGVTPDLTVLAKILAGGFPGAALAGKPELLEPLQRGPTSRGGARAVRHHGTFNANPVSAAAGVACLQLVAEGHPQRRAAELASELAAVAEEAGARVAVPVHTRRQASIVQIQLSAPIVSCTHIDFAFRREMQARGVDPYPGAKFFVSSAHTSDDVAATGEALEGTLVALREVIARSVEPVIR